MNSEQNSQSAQISIGRRIGLLCLFPLLVLDGLANLIILQSFKKTLSGEAHYHRNHKYWNWTAVAIDWLFFWDPGHCAEQAAGEKRHGSWWALWLYKWKGGNDAIE